MIIGQVKCIVEAVAKVTLDSAGSPAPPNSSFQNVVKRAHDLLIKQKGELLSNDSAFGIAATQARKIATELVSVSRNNYGSGHGRASQPRIQNEMLDLVIDGGLMWTRWALHRLEPFIEGRPEELIDALITNEANFYRGELKRRLIAVDIPNLDKQHQRSLGVAVGQRSATGTFTVAIDGIEPCTQTSETNFWTLDYRRGVSEGLLLDIDQRSTSNYSTFTQAIQVLLPVSGNSEILMEWLETITHSISQGELVGKVDIMKAHEYIQKLKTSPKTSRSEKPIYERLAAHLFEPPPF